MGRHRSARGARSWARALTTCRARATSWRALAEFAPSDEGLVERCSADLGFQTVSIFKSYVMTCHLTRPGRANAKSSGAAQRDSGRKQKRTRKQSSATYVREKAARNEIYQNRHRKTNRTNRNHRRDRDHDLPTQLEAVRMSGARTYTTKQRDQDRSTAIEQPRRAALRAYRKSNRAQNITPHAYHKATSAAKLPPRLFRGKAE